MCQRTKSLNSEGNCNVCAEVIKENEKKRKDIEKNDFQWVKVDFKLLLGGVINILAQHDTIVKNEEKVKHLEHAQVTNQSRIEALENWVLR